MPMDKHWKQITPSGFAWESDALAFARQKLPGHDPYRAWANFEFIALDGSINEVDLLVLTPKGLYLVEIKSHPGTISGDAGTWQCNFPDGRRRSFDNPRILAERKAKKLASLLQIQPSVRKSKERFPYITSLVFLSHETVLNKLDGPAGVNVCTRQNFFEELTHMDANWRHPRLSTSVARMISRAMEECGVKESSHLQKVGQYELTELVGETDLYQEWLGKHAEVEMVRKVRIYLARDKSAEDAHRLSKAAQLELRLLEGVEHPGILKAMDLQSHEHGPALIYEHDTSAIRLDLWLNDLGEGKFLDTFQAINLLRAIAEAVGYAHGQQLHHRALSPQSIYIKPLDQDRFSVKIANWATAERIFENETRQISAFSHLTKMIQEEAGPYVALEAHSLATANGELMDIFSLGAIAYLLFTGRPPAESEFELQDKLGASNGLLITDALNGASDSLQFLVQYATHPDPDQRVGSVTEFLDCLESVEDDFTRPDHERTKEPTEAREGDTFPGGITIKKGLGKGACSRAFLVDHLGQERVLKMALSPEHNRRLRQEGETLSQLRHQSVVAHYKTLDILGHTSLVIEYANEGTLAQRLRKSGAIQLELLERFGEDLLSAVMHLEAKALVHRDIKPENIGVSLLGNQLHLVLFDFSLSNVGADNITAGTAAYMDPFIRDQGRRRWDDFAERFSVALTLYEMAAGALPRWASGQGLPALDGELEVDPSVFDPTLRDKMTAFFAKCLARDVHKRFSSSEEMLRAWRQVFLEAAQSSRHPTLHADNPICPLTEAQPDTQIGLLPLSPQALDALTRRNINTVADLIKLNRSQVRVWDGAGIKTRDEISRVILELQKQLVSEHPNTPLGAGITTNVSVDRLFAMVVPKVTKATDPARQRFLNEYLGRLDGDAPLGHHQAYWPTITALCGAISMESAEARELLDRLTTQWSKTPEITELRNDIAQLLTDNGGVMTAVELADALLLRRGSVQESPVRERWAQAVLRAAVETEFTKQEPRWILRRSGNRFIIADDRKGLGEELAEYAESLGQLADECAQITPLLSPIRAQEKIRSIPAPADFIGLSSHRLPRLAVAASQQAALSSRAEFYPRGMRAELALELAQGALLGSRALTVKDVQERVRGRYPAAEPLPGRPKLDELMTQLDMGFEWDPTHGESGAYRLKTLGFTQLGTQTRTHYYGTVQAEGDVSSAQEVKLALQEINNAVTGGRFLALTVRPSLMEQAKRKLGEFDVKSMSFDELLIRHLHLHCSTLPNPPRWSRVLEADAADPSSTDWHNLQRLVHRVLPGITAEILAAGQPVLLTDPGLIGRYNLVHTWLNDLRGRLVNGLVLLIAADAQQPAAVIDKVTVPRGAGSSEFVRLPSSWVQMDGTA